MICPQLDPSAYPAVLFAVEYLRRERVPLPLLLLALGAHLVLLVVHARPRDVHRLELDREALEDHEDALLVRHDLKGGRNAATVNEFSNNERCDGVGEQKVRCPFFISAQFRAGNAATTTYLSMRTRILRFSESWVAIQSSSKTASGFGSHFGSSFGGL